MSEGRAPFGRGRTAASVLAQVIRFSTYVGARTPVGIAHRAAEIGGTLEWLARPRKRHRLAENLSHAVDASSSSKAVRRLVRTEILNEARRSADLLWALGKPEEFLDTVEYLGVEHAQQAAREGRGLILAGVHLGGWEVATSVPRRVLSVPTAVVVADDWLAWAIERSRVAAGLTVLYPSGPPLEAVRHLRRGGALLVLGDDARWATRRRRVRFLDSPVELAAGIATLARLSQAPVSVFSVLPTGPRRWSVRIDPVLPPPAIGASDAGEQELMEALAGRWGELIRENPQHWAAAHPIVWPD